MRKVLKLISVNILVLVMAVLFLNASVILFYQAVQIVSPPGTLDKRAELPNYNGLDWADIHFKEFNSIPTEYRSYIGWRRLPYQGKTVTINHQGIRETPQSPLAKDDALLVSFLGGSTMWGTGAPDHQTIPAYFSMNAKGKYRTQNLAETGYNAFQGFLFLKLQIINGLRPDLVIAYDGVNEQPTLYPENRLFSHHRENQIRDRMKGADQGQVPSLQEFFIKPLQVVTTKIAERLRLLSEAPPQSITTERINQTARILLESWLATKQLAEQNGADFLAILQPNAHLGHPRLDHLELQQDNKKYDFYPVVMQLLKEPRYQELNDKVVDVTNVFDVDEMVYVDFCHVSPNGNRLVAERIYQLVISKYNAISQVH